MADLHHDRHPEKTVTFTRGKMQMCGDADVTSGNLWMSMQIHFTHFVDGGRKKQTYKPLSNTYTMKPQVDHPRLTSEVKYLLYDKPVRVVQCCVQTSP